MDYAATLKIAGQVAGIGGLALGVLLVIFREVVRKNIFPDLAQVQAYRIIRLIVVLTFLVAFAGVAAWGYVQSHAVPVAEDPVFPAQSAEPAMLAHLALVDQRQFRAAWEAMASEARRRMQYEFVAKAYETQRDPLGKVLKRDLYGVTPLRQLPDQTRGAFTVATYVSDFEKGGRFLEAVTAIAEDGAWKVLFHQLAPCATPTCIPPRAPG